MTSFAPGTPQSEIDALIDPVTGLPRINLSPLVTPSVPTTPPGYNPGSQLAKWFPSGTSINSWKPSVDSALTRPIDPTVLVPSTTQEVLGDINGLNGGEGRGGLGPGDSGFGNQQAESPSWGDFAKSTMTGVGAILGGPISAAALAANIATNSNKSPLDRVRDALSYVTGNLTTTDLNNEMGTEAGRNARSGLGPTSQDVQSALNEYADRVGAFDTAPNAPNAPAPEVSALDGGGFNGPGNDAESGGGYAGPGGGTGGDFAANGGLIGYASGGSIGFASGGDLAPGSYILPSDTLSGDGNGSTLAGARRIGMALGGLLVDGPGDGRSDDIPFRGPGGREIRLSNGEMIIPPAGVQAAGGADKLDRMVMQTRKKRRKALSAFGPPAR